MQLVALRTSNTGRHPRSSALQHESARFGLQPDSLGNAVYVARCEHLAVDDRRIGEVCRLCGPERPVAMRTAEQRHDLAFGEDDPVAVAGVHG